MDSPLLIHPSTTIEIQAKPEIAAKPETSPPFLIGQILIRIALVFAIAAACIVANHTTSNSFEVSVVNAVANTPTGRRFHLMFVSNGKISQFLYSSNKIIEQVIYPTGSFPRKPINHITIHLSGQNLTDMVAVHTGFKPGEFSVVLGHGFLSSENPAIAFRIVLHRAMASVRVWDGPEEVVSAMVEYLAMQATLKTFGTIDARLDGSCWSPGFLRYSESIENGFVARLNQQLRDRYTGLGLLNRSMCEAYKASLTT
ncbi:Peptidase of plants and bacteria [Carex littledalei]|uniref:Peptidase of plants and bacteria n=1 Tax=Carex littledalei TaxID=544730 RepID=A0A833RVY6_9POAL|nr:Peptidase of plants and bacteria [Carex littledalei]